MKKLLLISLLLSGAVNAASWECISRWPMGACSTWRTPVYRGWIVASEGAHAGEFGLTYVPDINHQWKP